MWTFIRYELRHYLRTPMVWIFLAIYTVFCFFATASDGIVIGGSYGNIFRNAPYVIMNYYALLSVLFQLVLTTAFMNGTANRDFEYGMYQFVFSSPIRKSHYFFGKFLGASIMAVLPMIGISVGILLAGVISPLFPGFAPAERFGEVQWAAHLNALLTFAIPNVLIAGVLLFSLAMSFRSTIVSFVGTMVLLVLYLVATTYVEDIKNQTIAGLIDPFGISTYGLSSRYLTVAEKNYGSFAPAGIMLFNRLLWLAVMAVLLLLVYLRFSFSTRKQKAKKQKTSRKPAPALSPKMHIPRMANRFSPRILWNLIRFETRTVVRNPVFIILMAIGLIVLIVNLASVTSSFGTTRYPVTYIVADYIEDAFNFFMYAFIIFYTGVLVWKERDAKINEIQDAMPVKNGMLLVSKLVAILVAVFLVLSCAILLGMVAQLLYGYHQLEFGVYVKQILVIRMTQLFFLTVISLLFHILINNRYIAYFAFIAFMVFNLFGWALFDIDSNMVKFIHRPRITYSDMNGFGPFVAGTSWFSLYWSLFCLLLCFVVSLFYIRGRELHVKRRMQTARSRFSGQKPAILAAVALFVLCGGFVFYNTEILNHHDPSDQAEDNQEAYERSYRKYEGLAQPRFRSIDYDINIYPQQRKLVATAHAWLRNMTGKPIPELHFTLPSDSLEINVPGATLTKRDRKLSYRIFRLQKPMAPGDSIAVSMRFSNISRGFENEVSFTELTDNGTFFNNTDIMASIGYDRNLEISDKNERRKRGLPVRRRMPSLDDGNLKARANNYVINDADWVRINTVISTSADQTAIAPGSLEKQWKKDGRNYFQYKLDQKALNFYSFLSARYEIAREKWNGIDLEVYYDRKHDYNVANMLKTMRKSLDYYTRNFGPYYQKQCRIIEFPRYAGFAQAFPGTMPYSESIGFITDLREVKEKDIDMVFYVVAHEMGHQWWAHQLCGANMQGSEMMSEGFAQYSALMVMEKEYGKDRMKKFLEYEMDDYLAGRSSESEAERPLMKTENQQYIHYNKASVVMYYLKEMIGEEKTNQALRNLLLQFAYKEPPYATSNYAVREFRKVTPDSLQYLIPDLFENITVFNNRTLEAKYEKKGPEYIVTMKTSSEKFRSDSIGNETPVAIADYIDVAVFGQPQDDAKLGKVLARKRVRITKKENQFRFSVKQRPENAGIDPYNYLIDRVPDDNLKAF